MRLLTPYFFNDVDRLFDDVSFRPFNHLARASQTMFETSENDERFVISADLPGVKSEDLKVEVNGNVLTISGERKRDGSEHRTEAFKRLFTLPASVDSEHIEARLEDGVLEIHLPKTPAEKPRLIEVQKTSPKSIQAS